MDINPDESYKTIGHANQPVVKQEALRTEKNIQKNLDLQI